MGQEKDYIKTGTQSSSSEKQHGSNKDVRRAQTTRYRVKKKIHF